MQRSYNTKHRAVKGFQGTAAPLANESCQVLSVSFCVSLPDLMLPHRFIDFIDLLYISFAQCMMFPRGRQTWVCVPVGRAREPYKFDEVIRPGSVKRHWRT